MVKNTENVISLYSGGGGLDIGFRLAIPNARTVCYVEREISSVAVLVEGMEKGILDDAPIWSDSSTFDGSPWIGKVDWIIGGFPCQPWSIAGKRKGTEDERWLWDDIKQIGLSVRPKGFFLENVSGLITGHGIDTILGDLSEMGFDAQWGSVKAADIGASHRRERVFILAYKRGIRWGGWSQGNEERVKLNVQTERPFSKCGSQLAHTKGDGLTQTERVDGWGECQSQEGNEIRNISRARSNSELEDTNDTRFHRTQPNGTERKGEKTNQEQAGFSLSRTRGSSEDGQLDDTKHNGQSSLSRNKSRSTEQSESRQPSKYVGNTKRKGLERHSEHSSSVSEEREKREDSGDVSSGVTRKLADTDGKRPDKIQIRWELTSNEELGDAEQKKTELKTFPPNPNSAEWERIVRDYPKLAPALQKSAFESDIRRVADGVATGLHRVDRLRILGNGVVPLQAAYALTVLARRIND